MAVLLGRILPGRGRSKRTPYGEELVHTRGERSTAEQSGHGWCRGLYCHFALAASWIRAARATHARWARFALVSIRVSMMMVQGHARKLFLSLRRSQHGWLMRQSTYFHIIKSAESLYTSTLIAETDPCANFIPLLCFPFCQHGN